MRKVISISVLFIALFLWHFYTLKIFPKYSYDDGVTASRVSTLIEYGSAVGKLEKLALQDVPNYEKLISPLPYYITAMPVYFFKEINLLNVRLANLILITIILILTFLVGAELKDWHLGVLSTLMLGFSRLFTYSSHLARQDIYSTVIGMLALYLFLRNKKKYLLLDFFIGVLLVSGLYFHPRIVIYVGILSLMYLESSGIKKIFSKNSFSYFSGVMIAGFACYFVSINPHMDSQREVLRITVANSRNLPILSLDFWQSFESLKYVFTLLRQESYLFLGIFFEIIFNLFSFTRVNFRYLTLFLGTALLAALLVAEYTADSIIIVMPLYVIGSAAFLQRFFKQKYFYLTLIIVMSIAYRSYSYISSYVASDCNTKIENRILESKKFLDRNSIILGVDYFWLGLQEYNFNSWYVLNYIKRRDNINLEQAFKKLRPKYLMINSSFYFFVASENSKSNWYNNMMLDQEELKQVLDKYSDLAYTSYDQCNGNFNLYKFSWD